MPVTMIETLIDHLDIESRVLHKESAEAKEQIKLYGEPKSILDWEQEKKKRKKKRRDSEEEEEQVEHVPSSLANQFKNIERATQTLNSGITHTEMQTEPPPRSNFCETVNQWVIYEQYDMYEKMKEKEEDTEKMKKNADQKPEKRKLHSDTVKDNEGTLLPLWKFWFEKANELEVIFTGWNLFRTNSYLDSILLQTNFNLDSILLQTNFTLGWNLFRTNSYLDSILLQTNFNLDSILLQPN
ncbi:dynein intermediate chain 2, ciliary [Eurytemora carolleeae]|uniref:dynein intermediate chain 2, ciliary n=1 Tax=Eurytemora carolleeae TaxID=1294199 RepID=UPI000C793841|nr:dynein intermediate chain 2, ciliary [Eurytemora carolleeae]|eukprot:XP_023325728.1 dynein intermediate chain 2, ciliary-like [Eurytemora affinis]